MKLLTRMALVFLTALLLLTAAYAIESGNVRFGNEIDVATDCGKAVLQSLFPGTTDGNSDNRNTLPEPKKYAVEGGAIYFTVDGVIKKCEGTMTQVVIPDKIGQVSITCIGSRAFKNCKKLQSVEFGAGIVKLGDQLSINSISLLFSVFEGCSSLTNINVRSGNEKYSSLEGILFNQDQTTLLYYPYAKTEASYAIPDSVTSIGLYALSDCKSLTSVKIPNSVTSIGSGAFSSCTNLMNLKIPDSVTSLGGSAFQDCKSLTSVKIPNGVDSIQKQTFDGCRNLRSIEIPASVTSIGKNAFYLCDSLRDVYYGGSQAQWKQISGINDSKLISDKITIHYNASMPDTPTTPEFTAKSAPTVNGHAITKAALSGLTEISVPVSVSIDTPTQVTLCVPFFDSGKFLGMGFVTATVDKTTQSVTVPVTGDVSGAGKLNVIFVDADFRPLSATAFDIAA